ncbi:MAG: cupin domain-containing protein [Acidobacteriota bacterium]
MTAEVLHRAADGPVDVALVTLAPGAAMPEPETHPDHIERIRLVSGGLCVEMGPDAAPHDLGEIGRRSIEIPAGTPHRLVNWMRERPAVYLACMVREGRDDIGEALLAAVETMDAADHERAT